MIEKIDGKSMNIIDYNLEKLKEIYPEAFSEGKVDPEKLLLLLGENVDNSNEKYSFSWNGKNDCIRLAQTPSTGTLLPCKEKSKEWETTQNLFIEGDNLEVLKLLQKSYLGRIKAIYIDPPYNTGKDFVYEDNFSDSIANYKKLTGQITKSNAETTGRYHTNWLRMIYPRLMIARTLLVNGGVIFISIDDNEHANLRRACDEVFGEENFLSTITWEKRTKCQNTETAKEMLQSKVEFILVYKKGVDKMRFQLEVLSQKEYPLSDENGLYREKAIEEMSALGMRGRQTMIYPIMGIMPKKGNQWKLGKDTINAYIERGDIFVKEDKVYMKIRPIDEDDSVYIPFWSHFFPKDLYGTAETAKSELSSILGTKEHGFETVKPVQLIKSLLGHIKPNDKNDDIFLDFFAGSCTTAEAVMRLNQEDGGSRKYICVQIPELIGEDNEAYGVGYRNICDIGLDRINKVVKKINEEDTSNQIDCGYKLFKLDNSNLIKWDNSPTEDVNVIADRIQQSLFYLNEGRTNMDFVYEIMLKFGMPLTATVNVEKIGETETYGIINGSHAILICLDMNIKIDDIEKMAETKYSTLIFADKCFDDANMLINAEEILKKNNKQMRLF